MSERTARVPFRPGAPAFAMGHVVAPWALLWSGLGVDVAMLPRPPPNDPRSLATWVKYDRRMREVYDRRHVEIQVGENRMPQDLEAHSVHA
jgi:hypothetical protein